MGSESIDQKSMGSDSIDLPVSLDAVEETPVWLELNGAPIVTSTVAVLTFR